MSTKIEDKFPLDSTLVRLGIHVLEECLSLYTFKNRSGIFFEMQGMLFAEWSTKHGASGLVKKSTLATFTWGTADNTAMLVDLYSLSVFKTHTCHLLFDLV